MRGGGADPALWQVSQEDYELADRELAEQRKRAGMPVLHSGENGGLMLCGRGLEVVR